MRLPRGGCPDFKLRFGFREKTGSSAPAHRVEEMRRRRVEQGPHVSGDATPERRMPGFQTAIWVSREDWILSPCASSRRNATPKGGAGAPREWGCDSREADARISNCDLGFARRLDPQPLRIESKKCDAEGWSRGPT